MLKSKLCLFIALITLASCSKINLNPFSKDSNADSAYGNATKYVCDDKQSFHLRMFNNNANAWVIFDDHEVSLAQSETDQNTYTSGSITLLTDVNSTSLNNGEKSVYSGCNPQS
jgi:uncharacterized protein YecT (DUF1311 family)